MSWSESLVVEVVAWRPGFWSAQWAQFGILDKTGYKIFKQKTA